MTLLGNDQVRLTQWLAIHPGKVVLSNQSTDRIVDLYQELWVYYRHQ